VRARSWCRVGGRALGPVTPASRPPTGSLRRARCLRARRRPGPWPGDSDVTYPSPTGSRRHTDAAATAAAPFSYEPMRCKCVAERASEKLVRSGRPGPWPGDSCVTTPHGVTAPGAALASEADPEHSKKDLPPTGSEYARDEPMEKYTQWEHDASQGAQCRQQSRCVRPRRPV